MQVSELRGEYQQHSYAAWVKGKEDSQGWTLRRELQSFLKTTAILNAPAGMSEEFHRPKTDGTYVVWEKKKNISWVYSLFNLISVFLFELWNWETFKKKVWKETWNIKLVQRLSTLPPDFGK